MPANRHQRVRNLLLAKFGQAVPQPTPHAPSATVPPTAAKDLVCPLCGQPKTQTPEGDAWRCVECWQKREAMRT